LVLAVERLTCRFGRLAALDQVDMAIPAGEIRALIGPNGAGKTTFLHAVSGFLRQSEGRVALGDRPIDRLSAHRRARLGLRRTFQTPNVCSQLSVVDNAVIGAHQAMGCSSLAALLRLRPHRRLRALRHNALEALTRVGLAAHAEQETASLSYGRIRLIEIARALMGRPSLLLLDEPVAGMNDAERADVAAVIRALQVEGITILVIEHDMEFVMGLADRVTVLDAGRVLAEGTPAEIQRDPEVEAVYLGTPSAAETTPRTART
jgi:ABC-type branched-subunit amino acid transport system ATPase component